MIMQEAVGVRCKILKGINRTDSLIKVFRRGFYDLERNNKIISNPDFRKFFEKDFFTVFYVYLSSEVTCFFFL
jgi:hypothetical protein